MTAPRRLRPGVALFDVPGQGSAIRGADGELRRVALPADRIAGLHRWWAGRGGAPPAELEAFAAAGHLGERLPWPLDRRRVLVLGGAQALIQALGAAGADPYPLDVPIDPVKIAALEPAAVCAVHDGPAPAWWSTLDPILDDGIAWLRAGVEGRHLIIEPIAEDPGDVSHADVRARRLAAAGSAHPHLAAYWAAAAPEPLDEAEWTLVAALLAAELRAWALGASPAVTGVLVPSVWPARRRLRVVDLDTAAIADHPVLPVPVSAP
ncbi:hypothetical protein ACFQE5_19160 [Pseudonocardia hispaniensis]|uniref:Type III secretion system (T3SS) SseB-like protein n=1 Tax=Pseudonocardia hispaniensis TaxID=904933 RepID=A0ABW1J6X4_9PSEU